LAFHTNAIPPFSALYLFSLLTFMKRQTSPFWPALFFALLFQFELVTAPLFLLLPLTLYLTRTKPRLTHLPPLLSGLTLGLLPQILYDLTHHFSQLGLFGVWIGYRLGSFLGVASEHAASFDKIGAVFGSTLHYTQKFFSWFSLWPTLVILITSTLVFLIRRRHTRDPQVQLLLAWLGLMLVSFVILGNASEAYFPALFVPAGLLFALAFSSFTTGSLRLLPAPIFLLFLANAHFLTSHDFLVNTGRADPNNPFGTYGPPLSDQLQATARITSLPQPVRLVSTDPGSHFPSYLDNYRYLILSSGGSLDPDNGLPVWISHRPTVSLPLDTQSLHFGAITLSLPLIQTP
jgi:hypothetical protein